MIIRIASGIRESLLIEARLAQPNECCGLLTGTPGCIETLVPAKNVSPHPATSFEIDPGTLMRTQRGVRERQQQVLGHYHSHPNGSAEPSPRDAARSTENGQLWLIIANDSVTGWQVIKQHAMTDANAGANADNRADGCVHGRFRPVTLLPV